MSRAIDVRFGRPRCASCFVAAAAFAPVIASASAETIFHGPLPYLCADDSPFHLCGPGGTAFLETFEDGLLNTPGVSASTGSVVPPGPITDSVDCDDGVIDGSGQQGHSFFMVPGSTGITFTFDAGVLGGLPEFAGIVWTDGGTFNIVTFEAFGAGGVSLGTIVAPDIGDGDFGGMTDEDRFFGVSATGGITAISIKCQPCGGGSGIEVDHLQYGFAPTCPADLDGNGAVDGGDLAVLLAQWTAAGSADLNCDGLVDGADLRLLLAAWGPCR